MPIHEIALLALIIISFLSLNKCFTIRFTKLQQISKEKQEKMQKEGIDVKMAASLSAEGIGSVGAESHIKNDEESKDEFEKAVENTVYCTVGSKPPSDGELLVYIIRIKANLNSQLTEDNTLTLSF